MFYGMESSIKILFTPMICITLLYTSFLLYERKYLSCKRNDSPIAKEEEFKFLETYEKRLKIWKSTTLKICHEYSKSVGFEKKAKNLFWHKDAHLTYCMHGKAASSMWVRTFFEFSNITYTNEEEAHRRSKIYFPSPEDLHNINDTVLMTVVRHPFTRLISFYLDKMKENYPKMKQWIRKYRKRMKNFNEWKALVDVTELDISSVPSPYEFLMYVIEENENCHNFEDPISCLAKVDTQWMPYYVKCSPCVYDFDVVAKVETMENDIKYISHKVSKIFEESRKRRENPNLENLRSATRKPDEWILKVLNNSLERPKEHSSIYKMSTAEFTRRVFELLSKEEKNRLRKAYNLDFLLFNYDSYEFD